MAHFTAVQAQTTNNTTFIGMADVLPKELRDLCSCADLFFARVLGVCAGGDLYRVEVAALPHYFAAPRQTQKRHVHTLFLSESAFAQLVEYDRRLATLPTIEVQEIVHAHAASVLATQKKDKAVTPSLPIPSAPASTPLEQGSEMQKHDTDTGVLDEDVDLEPFVELFVSCSTVREAFATLRITVLRERRVHTALLYAARATLEQQIERTHAKKRRELLEEQLEQIKAVRDWRRQRRTEGYPWQRVVALEAAAERGQQGWNLVIGTPVESAA